MKQEITLLIENALTELANKEGIDLPSPLNIKIEHARDSKHGDYACNIAMVLAKTFKKAPLNIAQSLSEKLNKQAIFQHIEIAGPGFINFFVAKDAKSQVVKSILAAPENYGHTNLGQGARVILEYVSANPTGPLHVGHGRGTAIGATLANILQSQGYQVHQEYYVNDAGRQMNILAGSVYLRYLALFDDNFPFPSNGYKGSYVSDIALSLQKKYQDQLVLKTSDIFDALPKDEQDGGDKEIYIDSLVDRIRTLLGNENYKLVHQFGLDQILQDIKDDLAEFGVKFDNFFSEQSLFDNGDIEKGIQALQKTGKLYENEGAIWFKSSDYGDEKDRVLKRSNGTSTYFASDVAYHWNKYDRKFDHVINVFGADHHGYVARVKAAAKALGFDDSAIDVLLVQFAILYRGKEKISMSTRSGEFVTLRQLREEVGKDAARFFYIMRKSNQHMDFDLNLAKSQSSDNPVYYVQYAHARVSSVLNNLKEKSYTFEQNLGIDNLKLLDNQHEQNLLNYLQKFPETLSLAARDKEPHQLAYYLRELAHLFHTYYNAHQFIVEDEGLRNARLCLIKAIQIVLKNGLSLCGVSAPEQM